MLDQHDGDAAVADARDQRVELVGLVRVHAGGGLVEQQQPRLRRERARHFEPALIAVGQVGCLRVALVGEAEEGEQVQRVLAHAALLARLAERALQHRARERLPHRRIGAAVLADHHGFQHREVREQPDVLERARDAAQGAPRGAGIGDELALEGDLAGVGRRARR